VSALFSQLVLLWMFLCICVPISSILLGIVDASSACSRVRSVLLLTGSSLCMLTECCSLLRGTIRS
jgi:hypothetical protein